MAELWRWTERSKILYTQVPTTVLLPDFPSSPSGYSLHYSLKPSTPAPISFGALTRPSSTSVSVICAANSHRQHLYITYILYPIYFLQVILRDASTFTLPPIPPIPSYPSQNRHCQAYFRSCLARAVRQDALTTVTLTHYRTLAPLVASPSPSTLVRAQPSFAFAPPSYEPYI